MLTLYTGGSAKDCQGYSRRDFLRVGGLGLGGLSLPALLRAKSAAAASNADFVHDKAVVLIFLSGGPSHIETFNPNMDAPAPQHSVTGQVKTKIPGMCFGGTFPGLARHAEKIAPVLTFTHPVGGHVEAILHVLSGGTDVQGRGQTGYSMGSIFARLRGNNHEATGLPTYSLVTSKEQDRQYTSELGRITRGSRAGILGPAYAPFNPSGGGTAMDNMQLNIEPQRLDDRRRLLTRLDRVRHQIDTSGMMAGYDKFGQQAVDLVLGGASRAFDLSQESVSTLERYDTSKFLVGNKLHRPQHVQPSSIGRQMLMTRRLIEAGCGFVTVQNSGWDMHADGNNPGIYDGMEMLGRPLDRALTAFLDDLEERGMSDDVLVVLTGDFGRTPKINKKGGRDHWTKLCTLAFIGGGLKTGQIIGKTTRGNDAPASDPITTSQLLGTVMHTLFDAGKLRLAQHLPQDLRRLVDENQPIPQLM